MITKEQLLKTGVFQDNKLDDYLNIINNNEALETYTERHYIIPQKYYKILGLPIDNTEANIVKLSAFDHILAHYLLCFCTVGKLQKSSEKAFLLMTQYDTRLLSDSENSAIKRLKYYAEIRKIAQQDIVKPAGKHNLGRKLPDETKRKISLANKGRKKPMRTAEHKLHLKEKRDLHSTTTGKKSIYNAELNKVKFIDISELQTYLLAGWNLGGKPLSTEAKQKIGKSNSLALKGKTHQTLENGKTHSGLISNKIECVETGQIFTNIQEAKLWLQSTVGIDGSQIKNCCAGGRETTGGYHWRYYTEKEINDERI